MVSNKLKSVKFPPWRDNISKLTFRASFALRGSVRSKLLTCLFTVEINLIPNFKRCKLSLVPILRVMASSRLVKCIWIPHRGSVLCVKYTLSPRWKGSRSAQFKLAVAGERWPNDREQYELVEVISKLLIMVSGVELNSCHQLAVCVCLKVTEQPQ